MRRSFGTTVFGVPAMICMLSTCSSKLGRPRGLVARPTANSTKPRRCSGEK
jgi:hypothetical protein